MYVACCYEHVYQQLQKIQRQKSRKTLRKFQGNFQHYVKKIEAQVKKTIFLLKKDMYAYQGLHGRGQ